MADFDQYQHGTVDDSPVVSVVVGTGARRVRVVNRGGTAEIAVTTNGNTPSLSGSNRIVPAAVGASVVCDMEGGTAVKLLSDATGTTYSVWVVA